MRRTSALTSTVASSPHRLRRTLAIAALGALALAACGTEKTSANGPRSKPAGTAEVRPSAAFTAMLDKVAQSCPPSAAPEAPPTGPAQTLPPGSVEMPPDVEPIAPTAGPEVELNARDWCASNLHEERIAQALWDLVDPTPTKVRTILNDLGYVDERIHDLKQSGATTRFFLDLRDKGGRLCLEGSAAGENTVVDKCVAPATGPFTPGERKQ
ncbi:hypothetical protein SSP24_72850 [Streptomyces spinoverrucosus]|uniref:Lipoprotein n=1 Tax=Streptomyces spinoverrucosus TaxID=284043 RepID=A0A4Y3VVC6_9ACTN|nr:hypothetical protein [Streptomyces spinoverrucosus]GEC09630.1 hypothetical protein SSP24_72850 [Streptomyces spinoverrucosus]GHB70501.1 hypothetical protein GCM10010397_45940 [Streptomyces spinoverrucosus]